MELILSKSVLGLAVCALLGFRLGWDIRSFLQSWNVPMLLMALVDILLLTAVVRLQVM